MFKKEFDNENLVKYVDFLDLSLEYYQSFCLIVNAIKTNSFETFKECVDYLIGGDIYMVHSEQNITDHAFFELNDPEIEIYYDYGCKKINKIIEEYDNLCIDIDEYYANDFINQRLHSLWHECPIFHNLFVFSYSSSDFIQSLIRTLRDRLIAFQNEFITGASLYDNSLQPYTEKIRKDQFYLLNIYDEKSSRYLFYDDLKNESDSNGFCSIKYQDIEVKVFNPKLALVLTTKVLPVINTFKNISSHVNGTDYLKTYVDAYIEGRKKFEFAYAHSVPAYHAIIAKQFVMDIHTNYFHTRHVHSQDGWFYVKKDFPMILMHRVIKQFGYYSGIVSSVDEMVIKHPKLFKDFYNCDHMHQSQPPVFNVTDISLEKIALIYVLEGKKIKKTNSIDIISRYGYSMNYSAEEFFKLYISYNKTIYRLANLEPFTSTELKQNIGLFESIIPYLSNTTKEKALGLIETLKTYSNSIRL